jgi:DNA polymerase IV
VETNIQPSFKGYPLIIAPVGTSRAVVYDMSEEAYQQGVRKGMPLVSARRLNKKIKILPPSFHRYERVMKDLLKEAFIFTPQIESGKSDGHIFMDVTGTSRLFGPSVDVAFKLKKIFKKTFNFDLVWSVAANKLIAKVATRVVKPVGEYIVAPGDEKTFLAPLPIHLIPGFSKFDLTKLKEFNLFLVSQVRALTMEQLEIVFWHRAPLIYDCIRGIDASPVTTSYENHSSLFEDYEFSSDTNNAFFLKQALYLMVEKICKTLRGHKSMGAAAKIIISYSDGIQKISKSKFSSSTSNDMVMFKRCLPIFNKAWSRRVRIRHIRLICDKSSMAHIQAHLFNNNAKRVKQTKLITAMDKIRTRFGSAAIKTGLTMALFDTANQHHVHQRAVNAD